jgi:hypothetical protein
MLVYFALILTTLIGFCGLAIDVGRMEVRTNQLQAAADAGALAAAGELAHGGTGSDYQAAANNDIAAYETANGIPTNTTNTTVIGATYGNYLNDDATVQVTVSGSLSTIFMGLLTHQGTVAVSAKSVARMPPCMLFLGNPTYPGGSGQSDVWVTSSGIQTFTWGCPIYAKDGATVDGFSHIYGGQVRISGGAGASSFGGTYSPPVYNVPAIADPLAYITAPTPTLPCSSANTAVSYLNKSTATTINLLPGTYCGQTNGSPTYVPGPGAGCISTGYVTTPAIDIRGTPTPASGGVGCPYQNNQPFSYCTTTPTVNFQPGLYIIIGGMDLDCVNVTGSGVTLYFTKNSTVGYGQMRLTSSMWQVNAPNDASNQGIPGVVVMSDRNWQGSADDFQWNFSNWNGDGVIYVTGTGVYEYNTPMDAPNYMNMVVSNLYSYLGEIHARINYANLPAGNPLRPVVTLVQ